MDESGERRVTVISARKKKMKKKKIRKVDDDTTYNKMPRCSRWWRAGGPSYVRFSGELEDMSKFGCDDEAFHISWEKALEITEIIRSRKTPSPQNWHQYDVTFYLKMRACFDAVPFCNLEAAKKPLLPPSPKKIMPLEEKQQQQEEEHLSQSGVTTKEGVSELEEQELAQACYFRKYLGWPYEFGSYSQAAPDRIPYHLYLLVKEADDIVKRFEWYRNPSDLMALDTVEAKISFFIMYFNAHLPAGWDFRREEISSIVASYNPTRCPKYRMDGYIPRVELNEGYDEDTGLTEEEMIDVMSTIHSRKTPSFWGMNAAKILFYCKLCCIFGLDYSCLEAASEDDVCLMDMGRNG